MTTYTGTATSTTPGITGDTSTTANGVKGTSTNDYSAIYGTTSGNGGAVHGETSGTGWAVYGYATGSGSVGTYGGSSSSTGYGVYGYGAKTGIYGTATGSLGIAVHAYATGTSAYGVYSYGSSIGVYGNGADAAGYFVGDVFVTGSVTKGGGGFLIDHPLDPANKLCEHSFVESPERKNVYDGVATADGTGEAVVQLPDYVEALNESFRYQLTAIGGAAPDLHVKQVLSGGRFVIAGAKAGQKVSWQLTGVRKDAWAKSNPLVAERDKAADKKGLYVHPEAFGLPKEKGAHPRAPAPAPAPGTAKGA